MALVPKMELGDKKLERLVDERIKKIKEEEKKQIDVVQDEKAKHTASRILKAIDMVKSDKIDTDKGIDKAINGEPIKSTPVPIVATADKDDILCPTCHTGHIHKLEKGGKSYELVCKDGTCHMEYVLIPKNADYKCVKCGGPLKKPNEGVTIDTCPWCEENSKAMKYDWNKALAFINYKTKDKAKGIGK